MLLDVIEVNNEGTALVTPLVRGSDLQQRIFSDSGDKVWLLLLCYLDNAHAYAYGYYVIACHHPKS